MASRQTHASQTRDADMRRTAVKALIGAAFLTASASAVLAQGLESTAEEREACAPDAFSLCAANIPDAESVKNCLIEHIGDLRPACRQVFEQREKARNRSQ